LKIVSYKQYEVQKLRMSDVVGTIEYMCPEIAFNILESFENDLEIEFEETFSYTQSCDVWSLGVTLYQLLTGERPFKNTESPCGADCFEWEYNTCYQCERAVLEAICYSSVEFPQRLWRDISTNALDLVRRCLEIDPSKRISMEQILEHPFLKERDIRYLVRTKIPKYQKSISLPSMEKAIEMTSQLSDLFVPRTKNTGDN